MKKSAQIANFNVVFGDEEKPMLEFFDTIIYPSFTSNITRKVDDVEYLFKNIYVQENSIGELVLCGKIVKKTILEVKSDLDSMGKLVEKNEKYSTAPYSTFIINLKNHRMIFVPNQKGSPTLVNFRSVVIYMIKTYTKKKNEEMDDGAKLPYSIVNIVGIPSARTITQLLENVEKINSLTLRFYPLNGDIDYSGVFGVISKDVRDVVGSKNGEVVYKTPKSIEGVKHVIEKSAGTIDPILKAVTTNKSKVTLRDYNLSEKYDIEIEDNIDLEDENELVLNKMNDIESLQYTNDEHEKIYKKYIEKILPFIRKR